MSLEEALTEVRGIGPKKAGTLMKVIEDYEDDNSDLEQAARDALEKLEEGYSSHAEGHLRRALED